MIRWAPMLPTPVDKPFDSADHAFEAKWDGLRCLCRIAEGRVRLLSRTARDLTARFPELQEVTTALPVGSAVLDGEICVLAGGVPNFPMVHRRHLLTSPAGIRRAARDHPAVLVVFDLLERDGHPLLAWPWRLRRAALEDLWRGDGAHAALSPVVPGRGRDLYAVSIAQGLEGIVAKHLDSPYVPGKRTRHWLKVRRERELDCVIGGYIPRGVVDFASLALGLLAQPRGSAVDGWVYVGNVGTGFSEATRAALMRRLLPLRTAHSPFAADGPAPPAGTQWVVPRLVARVAYLEFTPAGRLRHSVFRGLRDDKSPRECTFPLGDADVGPL